MRTDFDWMYAINRNKIYRNLYALRFRNIKAVWATFSRFIECADRTGCFPGIDFDIAFVRKRLLLLRIRTTIVIESIFASAILSRKNLYNKHFFGYFMYYTFGRLWSWQRTPTKCVKTYAKLREKLTLIRSQFHHSVRDKRQTVSWFDSACFVFITLTPRTFWLHLSVFFFVLYVWFANLHWCALLPTRDQEC